MKTRYLCTVAALSTLCGIVSPSVAQQQSPPLFIPSGSSNELIGDTPEKAAEREALEKLRKQCWSLSGAGKTDEAIPLFEKLLALDKSATSYDRIGLADAYFTKRRYADVTRVLKPYISHELEPGVTGLLANMPELMQYALSSLYTRQNAEAVDAFTRGVGRLPEQHRDLFKYDVFDARSINRARFEAAAYVAMGCDQDWKSGAVYYRQALALRPNYAPACYLMAKVLDYEGQPDTIAERVALMRRASQFGHGAAKTRADELLAYYKKNAKRIAGAEAALAGP